MIITFADSHRAFIKSNSALISLLKNSTVRAADRTRFLNYAKSVLLSSAVNSMISILAVSVRNIRAKRFQSIKQSM